MYQRTLFLEKNRLKCVICDKGFRTNFALKQHVAIQPLLAKVLSRLQLGVLRAPQALCCLNDKRIDSFHIALEYHNMIQRTRMDWALRTIPYPERSKDGETCEKLIKIGFMFIPDSKILFPVFFEL